MQCEWPVVMGLVYYFVYGLFLSLSGSQQQGGLFTNLLNSLIFVTRMERSVRKDDNEDCIENPSTQRSFDRDGKAGYQINEEHKMTTWYNCVGCKLNVLSAKVMKDHIRDIHKCKIPLKEVDRLIVKDAQEIQRLNETQVVKNEDSDFISSSDYVTANSFQFKDRKMDPNFNTADLNEHHLPMMNDNIKARQKDIPITENGLPLKLKENDEQFEDFNMTPFMPVEYTEFKPIKDPYTCQYCGLKSSSPMLNMYHVNTYHELTSWYRCIDCNKAFIHINTLDSHLKRSHKKKISIRLLRKSQLITEMEEIDRMRSARIKAMMTKGLSPGQIPLMPVDYSEFKSIKDPLTCQYCGLESITPMRNTNHINAFHEMTRWYRCSECKKAFLYLLSLQTHLYHSHEKKISQKILMKSQLITDQKEIDCLRSARIKAKTVLSKPIIHSSSKMRPMPVDYSEFKPIKDQRKCQYCGHMSPSTYFNVEHINTKHELTIWYKCTDCKKALSSLRQMQNHVKNVHSRKISSETMREHIITNKKEIDRLRSSRVEQIWKAEKLLQKVEEAETLKELNSDERMEVNSVVEDGEDLTRPMANIEQEPVTAFKSEAQNIETMATSRSQKEASVVLKQKSNMKRCLSENNSLPTVNLKRLRLTEDLLEQLRCLKAISM